MTNRISEVWRQHAADDLRSAEVLLGAKIYSMVCFHAQQAVEKSLKAMLAASGQPIPRIHNLMRLRRLVEDAMGSALGVDEEALMFLNDVYLDSRYPTDLGILPSGSPDAGDARRAYEYALRLHDGLISILKKQE